MSIDAYKRNLRDKSTKKNISNQELLFGIVRKDIFKKNEINNQYNRLTGNKDINSFPKNRNTIIHSNSTNHIRSQNKNNSYIKEKNFNIININVNNLIINNNNARELKKIKYESITKKKLFSKIGNDIIENRENKNNKRQIKQIRGYSNPKGIISVKKKIIKDKFNNLSNIQGVIDNLIEVTNCSPPSFENNLNMNNINNNNNNINNITPINEEANDNNNKLNINNMIWNDNANNVNNIQVVKENQINFSVGDKVLDTHINLWETMINLELHCDNKASLTKNVKKILNFMEIDFIPNSSNSNLVVTNIFLNNQLNSVYNKVLKVYFVLMTYIKFLLLDFNFELTIKSNIKRLLSLVDENLLSILASQVLIKDNSAEGGNIFMSKIKKTFMENYTKMIKTKKIRVNSKENINFFCNNTNKNIEMAISAIRQFSNNFFKIGYFNTIHTIFFDIFRLIDNYKLEDISNIVINHVLFFILQTNKDNKKNPAPKLVSFGPTSNTLVALGFINVPAPYLDKLPKGMETSTYTLVLDLDETLVHFFYTPSGGTFLIRPFCIKFLEDMSKIFEIVIFTAALKDYADSILDTLDPNKHLIKYRLYRHHTSISGITFCKDLSKIGRDLGKTLIVDNLADNFKLQPNNGIPILTWIDDMKDTQLNDLGKILKDLIANKPEDVRPIIKKLKDDMNKKMKNNMNINPFKDIDINKYLK